MVASETHRKGQEKGPNADDREEAGDGHPLPEPKQAPAQLRMDQRASESRTPYRDAMQLDRGSQRLGRGGRVEAGHLLESGLLLLLLLRGVAAGLRSAGQSREVGSRATPSPLTG